MEDILSALKMTLRNIKNPYRLISHSAIVILYCYKVYIEKLRQNKVQISMTEENYVYEHVLKEWVNGFLQNEYLSDQCLPSFSMACKIAEEVVDTYNNEMLHMSIDYMTPTQKFADHWY